MFVFLRDSTGVLSMPAGSRATLEMKTYTLKILSLRAKLPFPLWNTVIWLNFYVVLQLVGTKWTVSVCGVSGEAEVICIMNQYFLKGQGPALKMNQNGEASIQPVCHQVL